MANVSQLRRCAPIGNATAQLTESERNRDRNRQRNSPHKPRSLREVLRNRQRNRGATGSCVDRFQTPPETQPSCAIKFARLVQAYGTSRGFLLEVETILAELDVADIEDLKHLEVYQKQDWAQMLAYRMSKERLEGKAASAVRGKPGEAMLRRHTKDTASTDE